MWKMSSWYQQTDVKQQEMKDLVAVSFDNVWELLSKFEIQCQAGVNFSINFVSYSIQPDIVCLEKVWGWGFT